MKKDMSNLITGASLFIKACLAALFAGITAFLGLIILTPTNEDAQLLNFVCVGPFALVSGIFFLIMVLWILSEVKVWVNKKEG